MFWLAVGAVGALGAVTLQIMGPPPAPPVARPASGANPATPSSVAAATPARAAQAFARPGRSGTDPVAGPDPALLEQAGDGGQDVLPRVAPDGRTPMAVYAAGFDRTDLRPRVGLLIAGIGLNHADSMAAIQLLPGPVTLAISPYAGPVVDILAAARLARHEYVLSLPMLPAGFPVNDPDSRHALMTSLSPAENLSRLHWVMSRITGYVGLTSVMGGMQGEQMLDAPDQLQPILRDVADRGLLFIATRSRPAPLRYVWSRDADAIVDEAPADAGTIDQRLDQLAATARAKGSALGIVTLPRPVALDRVAAWAAGLSEKGILLAPVSALVVPPAVRETQATQDIQE
ncbi:MAG: hypothetical protein B7Z80_05175 [Rhodospirillales bacterium 20-64-7]|nr:MAG: hypothetical protein B7Z80_05175 [Rhodospirillales bacterium 20-64-7]HQT76348.1 divergent polysaccharide deacetylase family protein [Rhodopila sp.]